MNDRQKKLIAYLLDRDGFTSQDQIAEDLSDYSLLKDKRTLRRDVREINSGEFTKLIISNANGYKIATKEEAQEYLDRKQKTALRMLKLYSTMRDKLGKDGQTKVNNAGQIIELKPTCDR